MRNKNKLEDSKCGVCGCYCFSSPPYKWEFIGEIKTCRGCFQQYDGTGIADPARDYRRRAIIDELSTHEARIEELQDELTKVNEE